MNYVYDIILNFKETLYDFYEWNKNDDIVRIRRLPIFRIKSSDLENITKNYVKFDPEFLTSSENRCELIGKKKKTLEHAFLLTDTDEVLAVNIENDKMLVSRMVIDEELDTIERSIMDTEISVKYEILKKRESNSFKTRKEIELEKYLKKEVKKLENADIEKLKYIYYECFDDVELDRDKIMKRIKDELSNNFDVISQKLYTFFKLVHK